MKVIFLGAGASMPAGYPRMAKLLDAVDQHFQEMPMGEERAGWDGFKASREGATEVVRRILSSTNPEIVLSLLELYEAAGENENHDLSRALAEPDDQWDTNLYLRMKQQLETKPADFLQAKIALRSCLRGIEHFFWWRHLCDNSSAAAKNRAYLRDELHSLAPGDVVITTNWDTLAERVLAEEGLWSPCDGYGFRSELICDGSIKRAASDVLPPAAVKVLKLHGSLGWQRSTDDKTVILSHARLLQSLGLKDREDRKLLLRDLSEPRGRPAGDWLALPPSYLKQFAVGTMQSIWVQASETLLKATVIHIIGYSLPASDLAIQALLIPIRPRLDRHEVSVDVFDPDPEACRRWCLLLGKEARIHQQGIGTRQLSGNLKEEDLCS